MKDGVDACVCSDEPIDFADEQASERALLDAGRRPLAPVGCEPALIGRVERAAGRDDADVHVVVRNNRLDFLGDCIYRRLEVELTGQKPGNAHVLREKFR